MNSAALRKSLEIILATDDTFPARFYEILFERHPDLRALFVRSTPGAQRKMFAQKLCSIVDMVEDRPALERELEGIVAKHREYGVTDEMYPWVGEALIETLREGLGEEFTPEVEASWRSAYAAVTAIVTRQSG